MSRPSASAAPRTASIPALTCSRSRGARRIAAGCSWPSPSGALAPTSIAWPRSLAPRWPASVNSRRWEREQPGSLRVVAGATGGSGMSASTAAPPSGSQLSETPLQREPAVTIFERGAPGRRAFQCPALDVPAVDPAVLLPVHLRRSKPPALPEISEPEIVRHYVRLSKRNFDLDSGFYPLGSCTMKHNPRLHERVAALPGHARLHPLQDPQRAQGALELMWNLQNALAEISGLPHVSLQPSAGSAGELAGVLLSRAYHEDRGETRHKGLTPATAPR